MGKLCPRIPREHNKYHGAHTYVRGTPWYTQLSLDSTLWKKNTMYQNGPGFDFQNEVVPLKSCSSTCSNWTFDTKSQLCYSSTLLVHQQNLNWDSCSYFFWNLGCFSLFLWSAASGFLNNPTSSAWEKQLIQLAQAWRNPSGWKWRVLLIFFFPKWKWMVPVEFFRVFRSSTN